MIFKHRISPFFQVGYDMTKRAAQKCFEKAGLKPTDVDVIELHDCFSVNEFITYEALGLCPEGNNSSGDHCFIKMERTKNTQIKNSCDLSIRPLFLGLYFVIILPQNFPLSMYFLLIKIKIVQELPGEGLSKPLVFETSLPQSCWQVVNVHLKSTV